MFLVPFSGPQHVAPFPCCCLMFHGCSTALSQSLVQRKGSAKVLVTNLIRRPQKKTLVQCSWCHASTVFHKGSATRLRAAVREVAEA